MSVGRIIHKCEIGEFLSFATAKVKSNTDIYITGVISARDMPSRDVVVEEFLQRMHAANSGLSNFRVAYEVSQGGCCAFWKPNMVRLSEKAPSLPGSPAQFSGAFVLKQDYLKSMVVDYGATHRR